MSFAALVCDSLTLSFSTSSLKKSKWFLICYEVVQIHLHLLFEILRINRTKVKNERRKVEVLCFGFFVTIYNMHFTCLSWTGYQRAIRLHKCLAFLSMHYDITYGMEFGLIWHFFHINKLLNLYNRLLKSIIYCLQHLKKC